MIKFGQLIVQSIVKATLKGNDKERACDDMAAVAILGNSDFVLV